VESPCFPGIADYDGCRRRRRSHCPELFYAVIDKIRYEFIDEALVSHRIHPITLKIAFTTLLEKLQK
jgi:hypothetical protein